LIARGVLAADAALQLGQVVTRRSSSVSFRLLVLFFIVFSLAQRRIPGADNSDVLAAVGIGHNQNPAGPRHPDGDEPLFRVRMIRVPLKIHCLILSRRRQPHNDSYLCLTAEILRIAAFQLLNGLRSRIWQPFGSKPKGWRISRSIFCKILGIWANLPGSTAREGKRCITFI
jgi:hypothetical protein